MLVLARVVPWLGFGLLAFLAISIGLFSLRFLSFNTAVLAPELRSNMEDRLVIFVTHTAAGALAMLIGLWQFLPITRRSKWHRIEGRVYVGACIVGALSGVYSAWTSAAGMLASVGFAILAVLWFGATVRGYLFARQKNFTMHRRWMIRSYALTSAAITLRLVVPVGIVLGYSFFESYIAAAWLCWIINLVAVETWLALADRRSVRKTVTAR